MEPQVSISSLGPTPSGALPALLGGTEQVPAPQANPKDSPADGAVGGRNRAGDQSITIPAAFFSLSFSSSSSGPPLLTIDLNWSR